MLVLVTWSDAVDHSDEGIAVSPAGPKVTDLDPELSGDLCLHPLQQRLLGAQSPLVLRLAVDAALSQAPALS